MTIDFIVFFRCSKCGEYKRKDEFQKNKRNKRGLDYYCKVYRNAARKERLWEREVRDE